MKKTIPIFFTINDAYVPLLGVALASMKENASKEYLYKIYVIHEEVTKENQERIRALEQDDFWIEFVSMKQSLAMITDRTENKLRCDYFTLTIYFRLFIPEMFPQYDKAIYIDSDVVVPGDISELYEIDLGDDYIGACPDHSVANVAPDQDYLNAMCYGHICYLEECWDVMPNKMVKVPYQNSKLIHYNLFDKPWCYEGILYEEDFWKYARETEFYGELQEHLRSYGEDKKQSDSEAFERMLGKADSIPATENTFKKRYEDGVKIRL